MDLATEIERFLARPESVLSSTHGEALVLLERTRDHLRPAPRCAARVRSYLPLSVPHRCSRRAKHGEFCPQHARLRGGR